MRYNLLMALRRDLANFSENRLIDKANQVVLQTAARPLCRVTMLEWGGALASAFCQLAAAQRCLSYQRKTRRSMAR
jgi:hypothetical protein